MMRKARSAAEWHAYLSLKLRAVCYEYVASVCMYICSRSTVYLRV